jgi:hypothetical protein
MNIYLIDFQTGHKVNRNKHRSNHVTNHPSYGGWGLSHDKLFFLARLIDYEEIWIYIQIVGMLLGILGCMNMRILKKKTVNDILHIMFIFRIQ